MTARVRNFPTRLVGYMPRSIKVIVLTAIGFVVVTTVLLGAIEQVTGCLGLRQACPAIQRWCRLDILIIRECTEGSALRDRRGQGDPPNVREFLSPRKIERFLRGGELLNFRLNLLLNAIHSAQKVEPLGGGL